MNDISTIVNTISEIERRPNMFMPDVSYLALKSFLTGYFKGLEDVTGIPFNRRISEWLSEKTKNGASLFWTEHILHILANNDQEKAYTLLLDTLKAYLIERKQEYTEK